MTRARIFGVLALMQLMVSGCTDWAGYDLDYLIGKVPALNTMRTSVGMDPYEMVRLPPEHSVPMAGEFGAGPGPFTQAQIDSVAATLVNPFAGSADAAVLARGKSVYDNQCSVCHGPEGAGNGQIIGPGKFPFSLPVNGGTAVGRSDGYIYALMVVGRGLMPAYGEKVDNADRWAVVQYVRQLQGAHVAP